MLWQQYGGQGLNITRDEYLQLEIDHRDWWLDRCDEQRDAETRAIKKARKIK